MTNFRANLVPAVVVLRLFGERPPTILVNMRGEAYKGFPQTAKGLHDTPVPTGVIVAFSALNEYLGETTGKLGVGG